LPQTSPGSCSGARRPRAFAICPISSGPGSPSPAIALFAWPGRIQADLKTEEPVQSVDLEGRLAIVLGDSRLVAVDLKSGSTTPLVRRTVGPMEHLAGTLPGGVLLSTYLSAQKAHEPHGYQLVFLPLP